MQSPSIVTSMPAAAAGLIGRSSAIAHLRELLSAYRVVTLVGPGGIGKTALALEVARLVMPDLAAGSVPVELAALSDPELVPSAVASVLGVKLEGEEISARSHRACDRRRQIFLILDNCEHSSTPWRALPRLIVSQLSGYHVLATSREALRSKGSMSTTFRRWACRRRPSCRGPRRWRYTAVQLFIRRARRRWDPISSRTKRTSARLQRSAGGWMASRSRSSSRRRASAMLGPPKIAAHLNDRFKFLTKGRRTALPRHQTLRATLDWSYDLLPEEEAQDPAAPRHIRRGLPARCGDRGRR